MFDSVRHYFNHGRCLPHLEWDDKDNLKCGICGQIAAIRSHDAVHVFAGYGMYKDAILNQHTKPRAKSHEDTEWKEVKRMATNWELPEDPTYIPRPVLEDEDVPFSESAYDCEDSATFDPDLVEDLLERETDDE